MTYNSSIRVNKLSRQQDLWSVFREEGTLMERRVKMFFLITDIAVYVVTTFAFGVECQLHEAFRANIGDICFRCNKSLKKICLEFSQSSARSNILSFQLLRALLCCELDRQDVSAALLKNSIVSTSFSRTFLLSWWMSLEPVKTSTLVSSTKVLAQSSSTISLLLTFPKLQSSWRAVLNALVFVWALTPFGLVWDF